MAAGRRVFFFRVRGGLFVVDGCEVGGLLARFVAPGYRFCAPALVEVAEVVEARSRARAIM